MLGGSASAAVKVGVRIGGDGSLLGGGNTLGGGQTLGGGNTLAGSAGSSALGRTLSGATVPLPDLSAGQAGGAGAEMGSGIKCLGPCGAPKSLSEAASSSSSSSGATAGGGGGGQPLGGGGSREDAIKRLGKAAEAPKRDADYWNSLGGGNRMRD